MIHDIYVDEAQQRLMRVLLKDEELTTDNVTRLVRAAREDGEEWGYERGYDEGYADGYADGGLCDEE